MITNILQFISLCSLSFKIHFNYFRLQIHNYNNIQYKDIGQWLQLWPCSPCLPLYSLLIELLKMWFYYCFTPDNLLPLFYNCFDNFSPQTDTTIVDKDFNSGPDFQCLPLYSLLLALGNPTVNYMSLDIEVLNLKLAYFRHNVMVMTVRYFIF